MPYRYDLMTLAAHAEPLADEEVAMRFLRKHRDERVPEGQVEADPAVCEHITLIPKWDSADAIGREDAVSGYRCDACGAEFTPDEALRLRETESARIQRRIAS